MCLPSEGRREVFSFHGNGAHAAVPRTTGPGYYRRQAADVWRAFDYLNGLCFSRDGGGGNGEGGKRDDDEDVFSPCVLLW